MQWQILHEFATLSEKIPDYEPYIYASRGALPLKNQKPKIVVLSL
jgi:hypothetical protein